MKKIIVLASLLLASLFTSAQIQYDGCSTTITAAYPITLNQSSMAGARNTFTSNSAPCSAGSCSYRVIFTGAEWEIQLSTDGGSTYPIVLYSNSSASTPNPPSLLLGTWTDVSGAGCGAINSFTGDVQDSLSAADTTPPVFENSKPEIASITQSGFTLETDIDEAGTIYYVVVPNNATAPNATNVKAGTGNGGSGQITAGNAVVNSGDFTNDFNITGLTANTTYDVYVVAEDDEGTPNLQATPVKVTITSSQNINNYKVTTIPFLPLATTGGTAVTTFNKTTTSYTADDEGISATLPIGFNFDFYGNSHSNFYIHTNGFVTFDVPAFDGSHIGSMIPNVANPDNLIAMGWEDLDISNGGSFNYYVTGTAPNRKLVINLNGVASLSTASNKTTTQAILLETDNSIELHITSITHSTSTIGLENANGTIANFPPAYTQGQASGTVTNTAYRFEPRELYTWTGADSNDWANVLNWSSNTSPTPTADIIVPNGLTNYPTTSAGVTFNTMVINSGATFIPQANSTVTGTVTYKRNLPTTNWYLVASPVSGETQEDVIANHSFATGSGSGPTTNIGLAKYSNNTGSPWIYSNSTTTGSILSYVGMSIKLAAAGDVSFTGTVFAGNILHNITKGTRNGFNLLGNPYTAYFNSKTFTTSNTASLTEKTVWLWNGTAYVSYNDINPIEIAPAQGFFVNASANGSVVISNANRSHQSTATFMKQELITNFELFVESDAIKKSAKVFYVENKTTSFDNGYDSSLFGGVANDFEIYTNLLADNNKKLAIQTLPNTNLESMIIPVGLKVTANKQITFSADANNLPNGINIYLEDRLLNTFTRLDEANTTYKVTLTDATNETGRFYIHTASKALSTTADVLNSVSIYKTDNNNLRIAGLQNGTASVKLFNVLGKQVLSESFSANGVKNIALPNLANGVYLVQLQTATGKISKKIILE